MAFWGLLLMLPVGCGGGKSSGRDGASKPVSHHEMARALWIDNAPVAEYVAMQRRAVEDVRNGVSPEPAFIVLSQMGYYLSRSGQYAEGIQFLQEASDSLREVRTELDSTMTDGAIKLLGNLSNMYVRINLFKEADERNREALEMSREKAPHRFPDLLRMRSNIYSNQNNLDSALVYLNRAIAASSLVPDPQLRHANEVICENAKAYFFIEHHESYPDSVHRAIRALERNLEFMRHDRNTPRFLLGRGYTLTGKPDIGLKMMEESVDSYRKNEMQEEVEWALRILADAYVETGRGEKLRKIYNESVTLRDTMASRLKADALVGVDFRYRTSELKAEKALLESNLRMQRQRNLYMIIIAIVVIAGLVIYFVNRNRMHRFKIIQDQDSIRDLIKERSQLNEKIEELNETLRNMPVSESEEPPMLDFVILSQDDEMKFRKAFERLHPGFVGMLRKKYPNLTPGNEVICMLIRLNRTTNEIALALGISRDSVMKARYRLRSRFNIPKDVDLNSYIQKL